ncbi:hypothetical protein Dimus_006722 [Dionaea muscipula]
MANLQPSHIIISKRFVQESNRGFTSSAIKGSKAKINHRTWNGNGKNKRVVGSGVVVVQYRHRSTPQSLFSTDVESHDDQNQMSSSSRSVVVVGGVVVDEGSLVSEHGWMVRRMVEEESETRKVAQIQAEAFHEPVAFFNDLFYQFFQAEVLSALLYRLRNSPPDRYACLVAQPLTGREASVMVQPQLVGVVDVTVQRDEDVLEHLEGAGEYLYVSGIAVSNSFRRQKVATVLLKACEMISILWGHEYLVLRAYEDDRGARALYENAGYRVISGDPSWVSWLGRRRRILMFKRSNLSLKKDMSER